MRYLFILSIVFLTRSSSFCQLPKHTTSGNASKVTYFVYATYAYNEKGVTPIIVDDETNKITLTYIESNETDYSRGNYEMTNFLGVSSQKGKFTMTKNILVLSNTNGNGYFWVFEIDREEMGEEGLALLLIPYDYKSEKFRVKLMVK